MFFFDDNVFSLRADDEVGRRLSKIAEEQNILLMACDQCAVRRSGLGLFDECGTETSSQGACQGRSSWMFSSAVPSVEWQHA